MDVLEEKIREEVRADLKRKASDSEGACNSPKRRPHDTPLKFSEDTPEWARILFTQLEAKLINLESTLATPLEFATQTAIDAATDVGILKAHIKKHSNEMEDIKLQLAKVNSNHKALQAQVIKLEDHSRRDNLLFFGFNEANNETDQDCRGKIYDLLRTKFPLQLHVLDSMKIVRCHRKGKFIPGRTRPIIIKFHFFGDRQLILNNSGALRGTGIYINEDFSAETEASRKTLYPIVKAARENPQYKDKVSLHVDRVLLAGKTYTVNNLKDLPPDLSPGHLATDTATPGMVRFFGRAGMLSNFNHSPFKVDGISYTGNEQFYQKMKCDAFKDEETAAKVMSASNPLKQFIYGARVHGFNQDIWRQQCDDIMFTGLMAKFSQNAAWKNFLLSTGDAELVECNGKDFYWAIGLYMSNPLSKTKETWRGKNRLGQLLMKVRATLKES